MQKYFLAIVPNGLIHDSAHSLKQELKVKFNVKYALKSPAHVTLKMPFSFNEAKESDLINKLENFLSNQDSFSIKVKGTGTFGKRVIYWKIEADAKLYTLQEALKFYCKRELNLLDELSDRNYHPHMTIAFKDMKEKIFDDVLGIVSKNSLNCIYQVNRLALLKRVKGQWIVHHLFDLR